MDCSSCGSTAPEGANFCMECGAKLAAVCGSCGTELPAAARFCLNCGANQGGSEDSAPTPAAATDRLSPSDAAVLERYIPGGLLSRLRSARSHGTMRGERRVVSILFCDVQGSTAAAESLDPEEWVEIMNGAFGRLIAPVYRYEGTLARLMGDAILAFFGAPITHEDDPLRAVLAGLAIVDAIQPYRERVRREWDIDFNVRVGINTGLVVVGEVGSDMRLEYTAMGDAVNLAARMEQTAEPGTVQISEDTYRHVAPLIDVEPRGPIEVKGKSETVSTYRVLAVKATPGRLRGVEGIDSPMVGRQRELNVLRDRVDALRRGIGHAVSVIGEAGLGKSRLIAELRRAVREEPSVTWVEGRSLSYDTKNPYAAVETILCELFDLADSTSDAALVELRAKLEEQLGADAAHAFPVIANVLDLPLPDDELERLRHMDAATLNAARQQAVADCIEALASRSPLVVVLEDLHWADAGTNAVARALLGVTERAPLLLVLLFRPRREEEAWVLHETAQREFAHCYVPLRLRPLGDEDSSELVANLLHIEGIPESLRANVLERAEGNPFFVEEVIRSLIDSGLIERDGDVWRPAGEIESLQVPESLAALLNTRLDSLPESARRLAQTASVFGRMFDVDVLAAVYEPADDVEASLRELQRRGFVREKSRTPVHRFTFKHALTQEAAYQSLLVRDRRDLHRRVAEALELHAPESVTEIASHYFAAGAREQAIDYGLRGGRHFLESMEYEDAEAQFTRVLQLLDADPAPTEAERRIQTLLLRGDARASVGNFGQAYDDYAAAADALGPGDGERRADALASMCKSLFWAGRVSELAPLADETVQLGEKYDRPDLQVAGHGWGAVPLSSAGDLDACSASYSEARRFQEPGVWAQPLTFQTSVMCWRGQYDRALETCEKDFETAMNARDVHSAHMILSHWGLCLGELGRFRESQERFARAERLAERHGLRKLRARGLAISTGPLLALGANEIALRRLPEIRALAVESAFPGAIVSSAIDTALCHVRTGAVGDAEAVLVDVEAALAEAGGFHEWIWKSRHALIIAELALERGEFDLAVERATRSAKLAAPRRPKYHALSLLCRARALCELGRLDDAAADFAQAERLAVGIGSPHIQLLVGECRMHGAPSTRDAEHIAELVTAIEAEIDDAEVLEEFRLHLARLQEAPAVS